MLAGIKKKGKEKAEWNICMCESLSWYPKTTGTNYKFSRTRPARKFTAIRIPGAN